MAEPPKPASRNEAEVTAKPRKPVEAPPERKKEAAAPKAAEKTYETSFDCRASTGSAESTICRSSNLSALDRQAAILYKQSWGTADEARRRALLDTRATFVDRRGKCGSEACLTSAYVARIREISDIMARRQP